MLPRPVVLAPPVLAALGFAAPPAGAQGLGAQASVTATTGAEVRECLQIHQRLRPCGLLGLRGGTVSWATGCAPGIDREMRLVLRSRPPGPEGEYLTLADEYPPEAGSVPFPLLPGWRIYATVTVTCTGGQTEPPDTEPAPVDEPVAFQPVPTETATAESATVVAPPKLAAAVPAGGRYCIRPPQTLESLEGKLQARQRGRLAYYVRYATGPQHPLFGDPERVDAGEDDRSRIRLHARGAGIRVAARPERRALGFGELALSVRPKRAGTLRVWATVDGARTNARKVRVARGC